MEAFECQNEYNLHVYGKDGFESTPRVKYCGWLDYDNLPRTLSKYRVGLVWYNGESENFTSGISNKIFEYLHCGLHVIVSQDLTEANECLLKDYEGSVSFVDLETADWMGILEGCFRADHVAIRRHDFKLCTKPLLDWIYN
jgi:glycosyltransferase involved in cell wall biosynthesis